MRYPIREFTRKTRGIVLKRAIELLKQERIEEKARDQTHASMHVRNQENRIYHVELVLEGQEVVFTHCDCPYRGIGLCKHTAASLLYLLKSYGVSPEQFSVEDFVFQDEEVETDEDDRSESMNQLFEEMMHDTEFNFVQFLASQNKQDLLNFTLHYLDQTEDVRMILLAYLWYKKSTDGITTTIVS